MIPLAYSPQNGSFTCLANKNGKKKVSESGMLSKILRANSEDLSASLHSIWVNAMAIRLDRGSAIINPASPGFFPASQEEKEIIIAETPILIKYCIIHPNPDFCLMAILSNMSNQVTELYF